MNRRSFLEAAAMAFALMTAASGCNSGGSPGGTTSDEAKVAGKVTFRGKVLDGGTLHFNASMPGRIVGSRDAPISKDGSYTIKALAGQNVVTITPKTRTKATFGLEDEEKTLQVQAGENSLNLDFMP
ncbi:hypothetical protein EP7_004877 [Isosphaeraceae bacterium EP7]